MIFADRTSRFVFSVKVFLEADDHSEVCGILRIISL
jgi:hypothetical protein